MGKPSQGDPGPALRAGESGQAASCTRVGRVGRWGALERLKQAKVSSDSWTGGTSLESQADGTGHDTKRAKRIKEISLAVV